MGLKKKMENLSQIIKKRFESIAQSQKKSRLSTRHQVEAVDVWNFVGRDGDIKILLRLAKLDLKVFLKAKQHLKAAITDGIKVKNGFRYFLWLYRYYRKGV